MPPPRSGSGGCSGIRRRSGDCRAAPQAPEVFLELQVDFGKV
jgi:hypothetical protein